MRKQGTQSGCFLREKAAKEGPIVSKPLSGIAAGFEIPTWLAQTPASEALVERRSSRSSGGTVETVSHLGGHFQVGLSACFWSPLQTGSLRPTCQLSTDCSHSSQFVLAVKPGLKSPRRRPLGSLKWPLSLGVGRTPSKSRNEDGFINESYLCQRQGHTFSMTPLDKFPLAMW